MATSKDLDFRIWRPAASPDPPRRPKRIGYARVSTDEQNLDAQHDALAAAKCRTIYEEQTSGSEKADRPELLRCLRSLRAGDTLVVVRLDRLGRSMRQLLDIVEWLRSSAIHFESLAEGTVNGEPVGRMMLGMAAVVAEFERSLIRERTRAGLAAARLRGSANGRKRKLTPEDVTYARDAIRWKSLTQVAAQLRVSACTLSRYLDGAHDAIAKRRAEERARAQ